MPKKYVVPLTLYSNKEIASRQTDGKAKEIEEIAKYNIANGTHFWKIEQVDAHKQKKSAEEFEKNHPVIASVAKVSQDSRDAKTSAVGAEQVRDLYNTGQSELASELNKKYFGSTATGILTVPLAREFATYGLLGGGVRLLGGTATGAVGSYVGGKAGELGDRVFGTNWISPTGKIIGGFVGFAPGMNAATGLLRNAAEKGITMYMPRETFMNLRGQAFDRTFDAAKPALRGLVKYYGPTMGKTTAVKTNPNLVDFDDIMRQPSKDLLKKYGFVSKYDMFESGNQDAINEYQNLLITKMNEFKQNPANNGKILVVSQSPVANPKVTGFQFDNTPSIPTRNVFIQRNIGRGGDYEGSAG